VIRDPAVNDAMRLVFADGYKKGLAQGKKGLELGKFISGMVFGALIALLLVTQVAFAQSIPAEAASHRRDLVRISRSVWGMEAPVASLAAQIHQESGWRTNARSPVGAQGLTQFMPGTAKDIAQRYGEQAMPFDSRWAIQAQSRYMREIYMRQKGVNDCETYAFALSAYNGGEKWVQRRKALSQTPLRCLGATCDINPGITASNQKENREYPRRILLRLTPIYVDAGWGIGHCLNYGER
jgi:soluble lytic murein transglycosylase-like protein